VDSGFDVLTRHVRAYSRFLRNMYLEALRASERVWMEFLADNDLPYFLVTTVEQGLYILQEVPVGTVHNFRTVKAKECSTRYY
jgi:hypothetical protein